MPTPPMLEAREPLPVEEARRQSDPTVAITVFLLGLVVVALFLGGTLAVYDWTVPGAITPLIYSTVAVFAAALAVQVAAATVRWARGGVR